LETLFITAGQQMSSKQFTDASQTLEEINSVLLGIETGTIDPFSVSTLAADYLSISATLQQLGYEVQSINTTGDAASVYVTSSTRPDQMEFQLTRSGGEWLISP
jgi:hypothetical protein